MDDLDLVRRARRGDDRAFVSLARAHERGMYATAYAITQSQWDAADAVQDTLAEAYAKLQTLRDDERFGAWLSRILVNKCRVCLRSQRKVILTGDPPEPPQAYTYLGSDDGIDLMTAVHSLDPEFREVVALRYFRDMKVADIATALGVPDGTVKSRINRALGKLDVAMRPGMKEVRQ